MVRVDPGPHPAPALLAELTRRGFTGMPRPCGAVQWRPTPDEPPRLLVSADALVPDAVDGWTWAVADLRAAVVDTGGAPDGLDSLRATGERVGHLVADLHAALAGTARPATDADLAGWRAQAEADLDRALSATTGAAHDLLRRHAGAVRRAWRDVPARERVVLRVHGDLHVGQLLRSGGSGGELVVTDFDGNPVVAPAHRARRQPAGVDVAGMAQSLTHVGLVLRRHHPDLDATRVGVAVGGLLGGFTDGYRTGLSRHGCGHLHDTSLLRPLRLRQVCRELSYAAEHLPRWSYVPEAALPALLDERA